MKKKLFYDGEFESSQAAYLVGVTERNWRDWATKKLITPKRDSDTPGKKRKYSLQNLVEGAVLCKLKEMNVTLTTSKVAIDKLHKEKFLNAQMCYLFITGSTKDHVSVLTDKNVKEWDENNFLVKYVKEKNPDMFSDHWLDALKTRMFVKIMHQEATVVVRVDLLVEKMKEKILSVIEMGVKTLQKEIDPDRRLKEARKNKKK